MSRKGRPEKSRSKAPPPPPNHRYTSHADARRNALHTRKERVSSPSRSTADRDQSSTPHAQGEEEEAGGSQRCDDDKDDDDTISLEEVETSRFVPEIAHLCRLSKREFTTMTQALSSVDSIPLMLDWKRLPLSASSNPCGASRHSGQRNGVSRASGKSRHRSIPVSSGLTNSRKLALPRLPASDGAETPVLDSVESGDGHLEGVRLRRKRNGKGERENCGTIEGEKAEITDGRKESQSRRSRNGENTHALDGGVVGSALPPTPTFGSPVVKNWLVKSPRRRTNTVKRQG